MYDVTSRQSTYSHARSARLTSAQGLSAFFFPCILVGNKIDLCTDDAGPGRRTREVPSEEAEQWAQEEGLLFVEASARSGENVEAAFERATRDILDKIRRGVFDDDRSPGVKLSKPSNPNLSLEADARQGRCC